MKGRPLFHTEEEKAVWPNFCACNCGQKCKKKFVHGHNSIGKHYNSGKKSWIVGRTKETEKSIAEGIQFRSNAYNWKTFGAYILKHGWKEPAFQYCKCNCGEKVKFGNRFMVGHGNKGRTTLRKGLKQVEHPEINFGGIHSDESAAKMMLHSGHKQFSYISPHGTIVKMRSNWEVHYAHHLDCLNIIWKYEPKGFRLSTGRLYFPDFYLPELNEYHEVKGWMSPESAKK